MSGAADELLAAAIAHFAAHGIGDQSLRQIAEALGTNHRKLIYHFGSREGLLAAVVQTVERNQEHLLQQILQDQTLTPEAAGRQFWQQLIGPVRIYGGLFFELTGQAIQGQPHALPLRSSLIDLWLEPLTQLCLRAGLPRQVAENYARLSLGTARGLFLDLLITGDLDRVNAALDLFLDTFSTSAVPVHHIDTEN